MYGYGYGTTIIGGGGNSIPSVMNGSMVFYSGNVDATYYLQSDYNVTPITGANKWTAIVSQTLSTDLVSRHTIFSYFRASANERGFLVRTKTDGKIEVLWSHTGASVTNQIETNASIGHDWTLIAIAFDPTLSGVTNVCKIYINNSLVATTSITDAGAGNYNIYKPSTTKLTIGTFFNASNVPTDLYLGFVNQLAFHSGILSGATLTEIYNTGAYKRSDSVSLSTCLLNFDIDNATYNSGDSKYTVPDSIGGMDFTMTSVGTNSLREDNYMPYLNPNGQDVGIITNGFTDSTTMYNQNYGGSGVTITYSGELNFAMAHSASSDPDRLAVRAVVKGTYDTSLGEIWFGVDMDWDTDVLQYTHGGVGFEDLRNSLTYALFTQRNLSVANGTLRVVKNAIGVTTDFQSAVAKNKRVYIKVDGTSISYYYNNSGVLTQIWSTQTLDLGRHISVIFYQRDYTGYASPNNASFGNLKTYRSTPTDL